MLRYSEDVLTFAAASGVFRQQCTGSCESVELNFNVATALPVMLPVHADLIAIHALIESTPLTARLDDQ